MLSVLSATKKEKERERGECQRKRKRESTVLGQRRYKYVCSYKMCTSIFLCLLWGGEGCSFSGVNPKRYGFPLVFEAIGDQFTWVFGHQGLAGLVWPWHRP